MLPLARSALSSSSRTLYYILGVFLVFLVGYSVLVQQDPSSGFPHIPGGARLKNVNSALSAILKAPGSLSTKQYLDYITRPLTKVDDRQYDLYGTMQWSLPESGSNETWTQPLGEQLCIIDLDNRRFNESGQLWAEAPMTWDRPAEVHGLSLGVLNHWLYAKIHGYKYYYIDIEEYTDRRASWKKPLIISKILRNHKTCVYLDSDAVFHHLDLPFEWLMNYWSLGAGPNSLALALDPELDYNKDRFDRLYLNTGFIVAQNNERTFEILDAWRLCPEEGGQHPNCTEFRTNSAGRPTDQGGFGTYIRYDYPDDIKELPCTEANGYTQSGTECTGDFIQHLWTGKDSWINLVVGQQMPGDLLETFHRYFLQEKALYWTPERTLILDD